MTRRTRRTNVPSKPETAGAAAPKLPLEVLKNARIIYLMGNSDQFILKNVRINFKEILSFAIVSEKVGWSGRASSAAGFERVQHRHIKAGEVRHVAGDHCQAVNARRGCDHRVFVERV